MVFDTLLIDALTSEVRIARVLGDQLVGIEIHRPGNNHQAGDIILGRVKTVVKGMRGAFVDIGDDREAFLPFSENNKKPTLIEGQSVLAQIRYEAMDEKGARLNTTIDLSGNYVVYLPGQSSVTASKKAKNKQLIARIKEMITRIIPPTDGMIIRTAAIDVGDEALSLIEAEIIELRDKWSSIERLGKAATAPATILTSTDPVEKALQDCRSKNLKSIIVEGGDTFARLRTLAQKTMPDIADLLIQHSAKSPLLETLGIEEQIDAALDLHVNLPSGGKITIVPTPACVTIDVDTAQASVKGGRAEIIRTCNREACDAIMQQLQLRNLSGLMVIDFISSKDRAAGKALLKQLEDLSTADSVPFEVAGYTRLGLVECIRRRRSASLSDHLCSAGEPTGQAVKSPQSIVYDTLRSLYGEGRGNPGRALRVRSSKAVISLLSGDMSDSLKAVKSDLGVSIELIIDQGFKGMPSDVYGR